jgi:transposase
MVSNVAKPSIEIPPIDLSTLGVSLSAEAMQQIVDAVTIAITPAVVSSLEQQIEQKVRAEVAAEVAAEVTAEITTKVTTEVNARLQADWDARFDQAVETAFAVRVQELYEQIALARRRMFGCSSEALGTDQLRLGLFNEPEALLPGTTEADDHIELPPEQEADSKAADKQPAKRARGKRKALPPELPRIDVIHDLPESKRVCACGTPMVEIGEEVSEQLDIIPMQIRVIRHVRKRYACPDKTQPPVIAPRPPQVLPKSNASPGLLATLMTLKYVDGLPLARAEHVFKRSGVSLPRQTQARLIIQAAEKLQPIANLARDHVLESPFIHMDETPVQVLKEPGRAPQTQSYMWVQTAGPPGRKIVLFDYETSREATVPDRLLAGYSGYLMTDGYAAYDRVGKKDGMTHLACWAHARRGFVEAKSLQAKGKTGKADEMLSLIGKLYKVEKEYKDASVNERLRARQSESVPVLADIRKWLDDNIQIVLPSHKLGQAIAYTHKLWARLERYAERGDLPIDNNPAENSIRPFVMGRKAWLFSDTQAGAHASALIYSLVETAKGCGVEPYCWLVYVLKRLPLAKTADHYEALLPWNIHPQDLATDLAS